MVSIEMEPLNLLEYFVATGPKTYEPPHTEFRVETTPISHNLCGDVKYEVFYNGKSLENDPDYQLNPPPLSYNAIDRRFTVETDDPSLRKKSFPYKIVGTFENYPTSQYPGVTKNEAKNFVQYNNPCLSPTSFSKVEPENATQTDTYSNTLKQWQIKEFNIEPDFCIIEYKCIDVTRDDGVSE